MGQILNYSIQHSLIYYQRSVYQSASLYITHYQIMTHHNTEKLSKKLSEGFWKLSVFGRIKYIIYRALAARPA